MAGMNVISGINFGALLPSGMTPHPLAHVNTLDEWIDALVQPTSLIELATLIACI